MSDVGHKLKVNGAIEFAIDVGQDDIVGHSEQGLEHVGHVGHTIGGGCGAHVGQTTGVGHIDALGHSGHTGGVVLGHFSQVGHGLSCVGQVGQIAGVGGSDKLGHSGHVGGEGMVALGHDGHGVGVGC